MRRCSSRAAVVGVLFALTMLPGPVVGAAAQPRGTPAPTPDADADTEPVPRTMHIVLDASGSMDGGDGAGGTKMATAKRVLREVQDAAPGNVALGLRVYGGRSGLGRDAGCRSTELLVPVGPTTPREFTAAVEGVRAGGWTPIGRALQAAAAEVPPARDRAITLVSDGLDTCGDPPPCDVARRIAARDDDLRVNTVGFRVDAAARAELRCIADATGGEYFDAADDKDLFGAFRFFDLRGTPIRGGDSAASAVPVDTGLYVDTLPVGRQRWYVVDVAEGEWLRTAATLVARSPDDRFRDGAVSLELRRRDVVGPLHCDRDADRGIGTGFTHVATALPLATTRAGPCAEPGERLVRLELVEVVEVQLGERVPEPRDAEFDVELLVDVRDLQPDGGGGAAAGGALGGSSTGTSSAAGTDVWADAVALVGALIVGAAISAVAVRALLRRRLT